MTGRVDTGSSGQRAVGGHASHEEHDHIAAIFADRRRAEEAVAELGSLGFGSDRMGVAVRHDDTVVFEHDADGEMLRDLAIGATAGVPAGFLAGIAIGAVAVPGLAVGGILALGAAEAIWGAFLGGYIGISVGEDAWLQHQDIELTRLGPGEVLVVVCSHGEQDTVEQALRRAGGRLVPLGPRP